MCCEGVAHSLHMGRHANGALSDKRLKATTGKTLDQPSSRARRGDVFLCEEETAFYAHCLRKLVFERQPASKTIVEFGTGDGTAVIKAVQDTENCRAEITGYEINERAAALAKNNVEKTGLKGQFKVHHGCFFKGLSVCRPATLVANPPYLPAPDNDILMPTLFGGLDGGEVTRDLISLGADEVMLLIPSYSDPVKTMLHAQARGYIVQAYLSTMLPFGTYSSQSKVLNWIQLMKLDGRAFFSSAGYQLLGVLYKKPNGDNLVDLTDDALSLLTMSA